MRVGIIDYGMGNINSVANAVVCCVGRVDICRKPEEIEGLDKIILPGVGAFGDCMKNLKEMGWIDALNSAVIDRGIPILGICLGMQIMAKTGYESGETPGLGWFDSEVVRIPVVENLRIPHVGWNSLEYDDSCFLFRGLAAESDVYFVHSYYMKCSEPEEVVATVDYGMPITAAVVRGNIAATQFHPEKSQDIGLTILRNFIDWRP